MQTGKAGGGGTPMNKGGFASALVRLNHITHRIVLFIAQTSILAMVAIVTLTVILRYCFNTGLSWAEEVPRLLVTVFAFIACAIGVRDHMHVAVNAIYNKFPVGGTARKALDNLTDIVVLLVHAHQRRRAHGEALYPAGRIADHGHFDRVAVSADSGRGLCDEL